MQLEDYFEFISADEIVLRGTRVGIEAILTEYLDGALPEEIAVNYPQVTLEQVHAAITYYLSRQATLRCDSNRKRGHQYFSGCFKYTPRTCRHEPDPSCYPPLPG